MAIWVSEALFSCPNTTKKNKRGDEIENLEISSKFTEWFGMRAEDDDTMLCVQHKHFSTDYGVNQSTVLFLY